MIVIATHDGHLPRPIHDATVYEDTLEIVEAFAGFERDGIRQGAGGEDREAEQGKGGA